MVATSRMRKVTSTLSPTGPELRVLEDRVMARFSKWLRKHGYIGSEAEKYDAWWQAGANEPSGLLSSVKGRDRRSQRFDVNARVCVAKGDKTEREQLRRYVARPPFAEAQLTLLEYERVRLEFRSPSRNGQSALILHPMALMRRLAWLVPPPGQHQIRYCGVLAPASRLRALVVPAGHVSEQRVRFGPRTFESPVPLAYRVSWAKLLARVYDIDGHACPDCGGPLRAAGAVLPPAAGQWILKQQIVPLVGTGPPGPQLCLSFAS